VPEILIKLLASLVADIIGQLISKDAAASDAPIAPTVRAELDPADVLDQRRAAAIAAATSLRAAAPFTAAFVEKAHGASLETIAAGHAPIVPAAPAADTSSAAPAVVGGDTAAAPSAAAEVSASLPISGFTAG
jgi:hypothetical protein